MTCSFCGSRNAAGETRCRRCGRKPTDTLRSEYSYQTQGALAAVPRRESAPVEAGAPPVSRPLSTHPVQRPLFAEAAPKVIPFESYAPPKEPARSKAPPKPRTVSKARAASRQVETQGELEFLPAATGTPRKLGTTVEAVIYCDAPVATRLHRGVAAALDWSLVLIGYGLFLLSFRLCGGEFTLNKTSLATLGAVLPVLAFAYGLLWALAGTETYGMRWAHLQLLNFDGFPPEPRQRLMRFAGSCLSVLTCGLGLMWALADEESLTWQDHMSRTFPTPRGLEDQVFRRR